MHDITAKLAELNRPPQRRRSKAKEALALTQCDSPFLMPDEFCPLCGQLHVDTTITPSNTPINSHLIIDSANDLHK